MLLHHHGWYVYIHIIFFSAKHKEKKDKKKKKEGLSTLPNGTDWTEVLIARMSVELS